MPQSAVLLHCMSVFLLFNTLKLISPPPPPPPPSATSPLPISPSSPPSPQAQTVIDTFASVVPAVTHELGAIFVSGVEGAIADAGSIIADGLAELLPAAALSVLETVRGVLERNVPVLAAHVLGIVRGPLEAVQGLVQSLCDVVANPADVLTAVPEALQTVQEQWPGIVAAVKDTSAVTQFVEAVTAVFSAELPREMLRPVKVCGCGEGLGVCHSAVRDKAIQQRHSTHLQRRTPQHNTTQRNTAHTTQHNATQHNATQNNTTQRSATQHNATRHNTT